MRLLRPGKRIVIAFPWMTEEPLIVRVKGVPRIVPAGPRTRRSPSWNGWVDKVVGYNCQPYIELYTDPGGLRSVDPRYIRIIPTLTATAGKSKRKRTRRSAPRA